MCVVNHVMRWTTKNPYPEIDDSNPAQLIDCSYCEEEITITKGFFHCMNCFCDLCFVCGSKDYGTARIVPCREIADDNDAQEEGEAELEEIQSSKSEPATAPSNPHPTEGATAAYEANSDPQPAVSIAVQTDDFENEEARKLEDEAELRVEQMEHLQRMHNERMEAKDAEKDELNQALYDMAALVRRKVQECLDLASLVHVQDEELRKLAEEKETTDPPLAIRTLQDENDVEMQSELFEGGDDEPSPESRSQSPPSIRTSDLHSELSLS